MRAPALLALVAAATLSAACGDDSGVAGVANLGVAGASCVRSADCRAPLQCIQQACTAVGGDAVGGDASAATPDADATTTAPDGATLADVADTQTATDTMAEPDISGWETFEPDTTATVDTAVPPDATSPFQDCGELGVASAWSGPFEGAIDFSVTPNPLTPSTGVLDVSGLLSFDIECIESKFVVRGTMDGNATVDGQPGIFPFKLAIIGTYDPSAKAMTAKMKDGSVSIYGLIEVYFEGDFTGAIGADDDFHGEWSGYSTGTNQTFITGTAEGDGTWSASAQ